MNDELYSNKNNDTSNSSGGRSPSHREPHYEDNITMEEIDSIFSDRQGFSAKSKNSDKPFKVSIPEDQMKSGYISQSQSRVPKGKPVEADKTLSSSPIDSANIYSSSRPNKAYPSSRTPQNRPVSSSGTPSGRTPSQKNVAANQANRPNGYQNNHRAVNKNAPNVSSKRTANKSSKKAGIKKKVIVSVVCVIIIMLTALFAYGYSILGKINYDNTTRGENPYIADSQLAKSDMVENILFIGSDARSEIEGMRSDTMMLFSIDKKNKKIKLTSFLRDSYVCIPSTGKYRKLNAACSTGGANLVIDTIEYNFKTKIDSYVLVDFDAFKKFINLMGGIDVPDVTEAEAKYMRDEVKIKSVKSGTNHFNGKAALWYCRIRYLDDDFHRTQRQRKVISAIINKATKLGPTKLFKIVEEVLPLITTDVSRNELVSLGAGALVKYLHYDILQHQIPAKGTWSNASIRGEGAVLKMDIQKNADLLYDFIYKETGKEQETKKDK